MRLSGIAAAAGMLCVGGCASFQRCPVRGGEEAILYPTYAYKTGDGRLAAPVRGRIFKPAKPSAAQQVTTAVIDEIFRFAGKEGSADILRERLAFFLAEGRSGRKAAVSIGGEQAGPKAAAGPYGLLQAEASVDPQKVRADRPGWTSSRLEGCREQPGGKVQLLEEEGLSVVVHIEDALREAGAGDRAALFTSTFLQPYVPVKGMPELLGRWEERGARFHYLSNLPWQLYPALEDFFSEHGIPEGSVGLSDWRRPSGGTGALAIVQEVLELLRSARGAKEEEISALMRRFPKRRFVLIGGAAGRDPELFGSLARRFPEQTALIAVRGGAEPPDQARLDAAFDRIDRSKWVVFKDPSELAGRLPK